MDYCILFCPVILLIQRFRRPLKRIRTFGYNDPDIVDSIVPPSLTETPDQAVRGTLEMLMVNPLSIRLRFFSLKIRHLPVARFIGADLDY